MKKITLHYLLGFLTLLFLTITVTKTLPQVAKASTLTELQRLEVQMKALQLLKESKELQLQSELKLQQREVILKEETPATTVTDKSTTTTTKEPMVSAKNVSSPSQSANLFLSNYGSSWKYEDFDHTNCDPALLIAIACRESSCGKSLKTKNNVANVGNTDSGATMEFETFEKGVSAICNTLNNQYLGMKTKLFELSGSDCKPNGGVRCDKWYASDTSRTWASDVAWFMTKMTGNKHTKFSEFRKGEYL